MKQYALLLLISIGCCAAVAAPVTVKLYDGYGSGNGGEFDVLVTGGSLPWVFDPTIILQSERPSLPRDFATFCLERDELISFGVEYVVEVSDTVQGGGNNTNTGDPLDPWTAWLYTQFATRSLAGYEYAPGPVRTADATALQAVFWFLENEQKLNNSYSYESHDEANAIAALGTNTQAYWFWDAARDANWTSIHNVRAMNLMTSGGLDRQSQLVLIPVPAAILLAAFGVVLTGWVGRRVS